MIMISDFVGKFNSVIEEWENYRETQRGAIITPETKELQQICDLIKLVPVFGAKEVLVECQKINPNFLNNCSVLKLYNKNGQYCLESDSHPKISMFNEFFSVAMLEIRWKELPYEERVELFTDAVQKMDRLHGWCWKSCVEVVERYYCYANFILSDMPTDVNKALFLEDVINRLNAQYGYRYPLTFESINKILSLSLMSRI